MLAENHKTKTEKEIGMPRSVGYALINQEYEIKSAVMGLRAALREAAKAHRFGVVEVFACDWDGFYSPHLASAFYSHDGKKITALRNTG